jgi:hypothetical protein
MLSDRFQTQVKRWRSQETIEVFEAALRDGGAPPER